MDLNDSSDRQGTDLHKREASKIARFQDVYVPLVAEEDILFVE
jgi:hypothetical protein